MKKVLALLLVCLMLLPLTSALMEDAARAESIAQLNIIVKALLDKYDYNYEFDDEDDMFIVENHLVDSSLSSVTLDIRTYYDSVEVIVYWNASVPSENRIKIAQFIAMANYDLFYSQLGTRMETGFVYSRGVQLVESVMPGVEELDVLLHLAIHDLDKYGDALVKVALTGADPVEAINEVE